MASQPDASPAVEGQPGDVRLPAPGAPDVESPPVASEVAWQAWLTDTGAGRWKGVAVRLLRKAFMAGWDSGLQQSAADPPPAGPKGGY